ncbi:MAG: UDP-N-acetylmuramate dehydrogenase [Candidatus Omnitrophica bacterium]|nr:UDP-N-acetylmuramate dehydrogenase [Candidatus Omnitrophota bacterium]
MKLRIPAIHNILNSLAAILVGLNLGLKFKDITNSIKDFGGAKRRFHLRADVDGVMLIDDYAHHPTEIRAVLDACRNWKDKRLVVIFQPHRYTRTKFLADDFGRAFKGVDKLILTDIYAASERPIEGVSTKNIFDNVVRSGLDDVAIMKKDDIASYVMKLKRPGDMILVLGAGDIKRVADILSEELAGGSSPMSERYSIAELKRSVKGDILFKEKMAPHTSFKIGGPADIWVEPRDIKDLKKILIFARTKRIPTFVIGSGTNLLVSDRGFRGMVIHLTADSFKKISIRGNRIKVGAGYNVSRLVRLCCAKSLGGIESLIGIPGTVGGAIYMNAGGSANPIFRNMGEFVQSLKVMDYSGRIRRLTRSQLKFDYRRSNLEPYIILEASLKLEHSDVSSLNSSCSKFLKMKRDKQVLDIPSAGCIFKNPKDFQFTCGQMIEMLGLKGMGIGGAEISERHANFIVNRDSASCGDVLKLIEAIKEKVSANFHIPLELEVKII